MDSLPMMVSIAVFLFTIAVVETLYLMWTESRFPEKFRVKRRLMSISAGGRRGQQALSLYKDRVLKNAGAWERFVLSLPRISSLDRMLLQAKVNLSASSFILLSITLALGGFVVGHLLLSRESTAVGLGLLLLVAPVLVLQRKVHATVHHFEEQLPEALDLMGRALRSGHALTAGFEMVGEEFPAPIGAEFAATVDEINLGLTFHEALENLCDRMPSRDLRYFTVAVLVQKETGGNIAELFDTISRLVRERSQFRRQLKALTAEGRLSALILVLLPIAMFTYIYFMNHDYIALLWTEKIGRYLLAGAGVLQLVGIALIRKIVRVEI